MKPTKPPKDDLIRISFTLSLSPIAIKVMRDMAAREYRSLSSWIGITLMRQVYGTGGIVDPFSAALKEE